MSRVLRLNLTDFFKGFIVAIFTAALVVLEKLISSGIAFTWENLKPVALAALAAWVGYLLKNLLSSNQWQFLGKDSIE